MKPEEIRQFIEKTLKKYYNDVEPIWDIGETILSIRMPKYKWGFVYDCAELIKDFSDSDVEERCKKIFRCSAEEFLEDEVLDRICIDMESTFCEQILRKEILK